MTHIRKPRPPRAGDTTTQTWSVVVPPPALVLLAGIVCDGCRWPERCRQDKLCWTAEKDAIAAEKNA